MGNRTRSNGFPALHRQQLKENNGPFGPIGQLANMYYNLHSSVSPRNQVGKVVHVGFSMVFNMLLYRFHMMFL